MKKLPNWFYEANSTAFEGKSREAIAMVFKNVDEMLLQGNYSECNELLGKIDIKSTSNQHKMMCSFPL